jgi:KDO2-lipid IV(A) lauroyltransferase
VLKAPVIYPKMRRVGRGRYVVTLELIAEPPYPKEDDFAITEGYIRHLEADILEEPSNWLWVHKKWKYRRSASKGGTEVSGVGAGKKPKEASSDQ